MNTIMITFANGNTTVWGSAHDEWDDYSYDGTAFIVKKGGAYVGIYNMNHIISIVVK